MTTNNPHEPEVEERPSGANNDQGQAPYEGVVAQVVRKVKNEPFLFVIAITALLIGLTAFSTGTGSPDQRFVVIVIALLAATVILGYYILEGLRMHTKTQQESRRSMNRLREGVSSQTPTTDKSSEAQELTDRSKYVVDASNATGVATGDEAKVEQYFGILSHRDASEDPSADAFTPQKQRATLEQELARHERNVARLRAKKAVYAEGEEPLSLLNQIAAEDREIRGIRAQLNQLPR